MRAATQCGRRPRKGAALFLVLVLVLAFSGLVLSGISLSGNAGLITRYGDRERELRYAAEAALQIGKNRLSNDPSALPDTGYGTLVSNAALVGSDGQPLDGVTYTLYAGPTGSTTGQYGRYASVVAVAKWGKGTFVRRLELMQESYARFAYWTDVEKAPDGSTIYFGNGDAIWGPVWSNDIIHIMDAGSPTAFHDEVGTAEHLEGTAYATFAKGYQENQSNMTLPSTSGLSGLSAYAAAGNLHLTAPTSGNEDSPLMRLDFVAIDLNVDGDSSDIDEGFARVYEANSSEQPWVRGDFETTVAASRNCGDWHTVIESGVPVQRFLPASVHPTAWAQALWVGAPVGHGATSLEDILDGPNPAQCVPGGDPHLVAEDGDHASNAAARVGGSSATFVANGQYGHWLPWTGPIDPRVLALRPLEAGFLFPLHRSLNPGFKGVIVVNGTATISGTLRGRVTVYFTGTGVQVDDLRYTVDPAGGRCVDMLGVVSANEYVLADNALNRPPDISGAGFYKNLDDTKDLTVHGVIMALHDSFRAQNVSDGPTSVNNCGASNSGRGCLYLTGGLIQKRRGIVGGTWTAGGYQSYVKRYSYDRCAVETLPPYYPTTGRFLDNRYSELDSVTFTPAAFFQALTPRS